MPDGKGMHIQDKEKDAAAANIVLIPDEGEIRKRRNGNARHAGDFVRIRKML